MESVVRFENARGESLSGVLHAPEPAAPRAPVVLWLSAGQKVRQGAWRMNVVIARRLARRGVPVLRFDFNGFGDSEGDLRDGAMVMDLYGQIQSGGFRDDVAAAARFALAETGASSVVMGGLCGGGISGLFAAPLVRETYGHVLIDLPVTISSAARQAQLESDAAELLRSRPGETDTVIALYLRKALDPEAWRRLLSGRSDYKLITQALKLKARERLDAALPSLPEPWRARVSAALGGLLPPLEPIAEGVDLDPSLAAHMAATGEVKNELVTQAFAYAVDAGQRVRFVNSSSFHPTFMGYFGNEALRGGAATWRARGVELTVVPDTNHIFSLQHSQRSLFEAVESMVAAAQAA